MAFLSKLINLEWLYIDKDCLKCHWNDNICTVNVAWRLQLQSWTIDKKTFAWFLVASLAAKKHNVYLEAMGVHLLRVQFVILALCTIALRYIQNDNTKMYNSKQAFIFFNIVEECVHCLCALGFENVKPQSKCKKYVASFSQINSKLKKNCYEPWWGKSDEQYGNNKIWSLFIDNHNVCNTLALNLWRWGIDTQLQQLMNLWIQ